MMRHSCIKNTSSDNRLSNYLRINPVNNSGNTVLGAKAEVFHNGHSQVVELFTCRGYMSAIEPIIHFGLGADQMVDSVFVRFPSGVVVKKTNVKANTEIVIKEKDGNPSDLLLAETLPTYFNNVSDQTNIAVNHVENEYNDYEREVLLPYKMSSLGPVLATADVNGDQLEDFYLGGSKGQPGTLILQKSNNQFEVSNVAAFSTDANSEDLGALFFDANGDGAVDLYVSGGGNEYNANAPELADRLYLNDGSGNYSKAAGAIPNNRISSSSVCGGDFDQDGDIDLFVCGRQVPGKYGISARSVLLENNQGRFKDVSSQYFGDQAEMGMATDAAWSDVDGDKDLDLVVVGEWMPISIFINDSGKFRNATSSYGLSQSNGWWNALTPVDIDGDGDEDFVAGNLGLNIKYKATKTEPFKVYVNDMDGNGTHDVYLGYYEEGVCYPVRGRQCSSEQMPFVKKEFPSYAEFAKASIENVLKDRANKAVMKEAYTFESAIILNNNGSFELMALPIQAQISPIYSVVASDFNKDGIQDLLTFGNYYDREVETARSDAGIGCLLLGKGNGDFEYVHPSKSGIAAYRDVRDAILLNGQTERPLIVVANNNDALEVYNLNPDAI